MADLVVAQDLRVLGRPGPAGSGIGRYVECLNEALTEHAAELGLRIETITEPQRWEPLEHVLQARAVKRLGADVLHTPSLDFLSLRPGAPLVVTLHDLAPLKNPEVYLRTGLLHKLRYRAVRRARRVMVHSRAVAADAERMLGIDPERIAVVPSAVPPGFAPVRGRPRAAVAAGPARPLPAVGRLAGPDRPAQGRRAAGRRGGRGRRPAAGAGRGGVARRRRAAGPARAGAGAGPGERLRAAGALHRRRGAGLPLRGRGLRLPAAGGAGLRHAGGRLRRRVAARGAGGGRGEPRWWSPATPPRCWRPRPSWPARRRERAGAGLGPGGRRGGGRVPRRRRPRARTTASSMAPATCAAPSPRTIV